MIGLGGSDLAVDLGTSNVVVYVRGRGIVLCEPSLLAVDSRTGRVRAVGSDARALLEGGAGSIRVVRPLRGGAITEFEATEEMLRRLIRKVCGRAHPRVVVVSVRCGATGVERRAVLEACLGAGARRAYPIEEPLAAAIGAGLAVEAAAGSLVVDIGGGASEAAVISLGQIVVSTSVRIGGEELDQAIVRHLRREHELVVSHRTAEEAKLRLGCALPAGGELAAEIQGRDLRSGRPRVVRLTGEEVRRALEKPVARIVDAVVEAIGRTPPELGGDIIDRGLTLTGGGSLLRGLEERLRQETQLPVQLAELPLTCVAAGSGSWLEELERIDDRVVELVPRGLLAGT